MGQQNVQAEEVYCLTQCDPPFEKSWLRPCKALNSTTFTIKRMAKYRCIDHFRQYLVALVTVRHKLSGRRVKSVIRSTRNYILKIIVNQFRAHIG